MTKARKQAIKKEIKNSDWDMSEPNNLALALLSNELEKQELIDFSIMFREDTSDAWLQVEYINQDLNYPVIVDYDFPQCFDNSDAFIETLKEIETKITKIDEMIK